MFFADEPDKPRSSLSLIIVNKPLKKPVKYYQKALFFISEIVHRFD